MFGNTDMLVLGELCFLLGLISFVAMKRLGARYRHQQVVLWMAVGLMMAAVVMALYRVLERISS